MNRFFRRTNGQKPIDATFIIADTKHHPIFFVDLNKTLTLSCVWWDFHLWNHLNVYNFELAISVCNEMCALQLFQSEEDIVNFSEKSFLDWHELEIVKLIKLLFWDDGKKKLTKRFVVRLRYTMNKFRKSYDWLDRFVFFLKSHPFNSYKFNAVYSKLIHWLNRSTHFTRFEGGISFPSNEKRTRLGTHHHWIKLFLLRFKLHSGFLFDVVLFPFSSRLKITHQIREKLCERNFVISVFFLRYRNKNGRFFRWCDERVWNEREKKQCKKAH